MVNNQPKEYDAVLGGQLQVPVDGAVLGGVEGLKKRLATEPIESKLAALKDALKYDDVGLDLVIGALQHQLPQVKQFAYTLLCQHPDLKAKQSIEKCNQHQFIRCLNVLEGHEYSVVWIRFSSDGKKLISASKNLNIKVWDLHTRKIIQNIKTDFSKLRVQPQYVRIYLDSEDKIICSSTNLNSNIEVWNVETESKVYTTGEYFDKNKMQASPLAISADGRILFSSRDNYIKVWDSQKENLCSFGWQSDIISLCLSPDGKTLFSGTCNEVVLWNWQTASIDAIFKLNSKHHSDFNWVNYLTISLDGFFLAGMSLKTIKIWNLKTKEEIHSFNNEKSLFTNIDFNRDGQTLVISGLEQPVEVWDLKTRQLINNLELHPTQVISLALSPDGKTLATGSKDHIIRLWDLHN